MDGVHNTHGAIAAYRILVRKTDGKRPLGRPRPILEDIIKVYLQEVDMEAWNGLICLRIRRGDGLF
jgi:hypothetical protein